MGTEGSQAERKFRVFVINWGTVKPRGHIRQGEQCAAPPCNSGLDVCFAGKTSKELGMLHTTLHSLHASMAFFPGLAGHPVHCDTFPPHRAPRGKN